MTTNEMSNPTLYMLVGVPGSGKSTWIKTAEFNEEFDTVIISTDNIIEDLAAYHSKTYDEVFKDNIESATKLMYDDLEWAIENNINIIWDQTNISRKTRAKKLSMIPSHYKKVGIFFPTPPDEELNKRLASRSGKNIPEYVMDSMIEMIEQPTLSEGFDEVRIIT